MGLIEATVVGVDEAIIGSVIKRVKIASMTAIASCRSDFSKVVITVVDRSRLEVDYVEQIED